MDTGTETPLRGGALLAAISNAFVALLRQHYGRGPKHAKTYVLDDMVVVVLRDIGFTPLEQTLIDAEGAERVVELRRDFQRVMATRYEETIATLTGRKVLASLAHAHVEPDLTVHTFLVDGPLPGIHPERRARPTDVADFDRRSRTLVA